MKKSVRLSIIAVSALAMTLGCSRNHRVPAPRAEITDLSSEAKRIKEEAAKLPAVESSLSSSNQSACATLDSIHGFKSTRSFSIFRFLGVGQDNAVSGAIDLSASPFTQMVLAEMFQVDSPEEFYRKAKAEYEAGRLSALKWNMLRASRIFPPLYKKLQYSATNGKLEEKFPGIFGNTIDIQQSLNYLLLSKVHAQSERIRPPQIVNYLTYSVPVFSVTRSSELEQDIHGSVSAAVSSLSEGNIDEKICGFILWQRSFAQLLSLKGHKRPAGIQNGAIKSLDTDQKGFDQEDAPGAFYDPEQKTAVVLESKDIKTYDPRTRRLTVATSLEAKDPSNESGGLDELLGVLESAVYSYESTSPAAPWYSEGKAPYILGDIQNPANNAILPDDSHALALGLITMSMKNLAHSHIRMVNARGTLLREGEKAAGMVLVNGDQSQPASAQIKSGQLSKLIRSVVYLENALNQFTKQKPEYWYGKNTTYSQESKTLMKLLGTAMYSAEELERELTPGERGTILIQSLRQLALPLALLASKMTPADQKCVEALNWDLITGEITTGATCRAEGARKLKHAVDLLGRHVKSPLLAKKAQLILE